MRDRRKNSEILVLCELQRQNKMACGAKRPCVPNHFCKRLRTWVWFSLLEIVDLSTAVIRLHNRVHSFSRCDDNMFRAGHRHLPNFAQFRCSFRQFSFSKFCFLQISVCSANCLPFAIFAKVCLFKRRQIEWNRDFGRQLSRARSAGTAKKRELPAKCRAFLTCIAQIQEQTQREIQVQIQSQILQLSREKSLECKRGKSRSLSRCIAPFLGIQFIASTNVNRNTNTRSAFFYFLSASTAKSEISPLSLKWMPQHFLAMIIIIINLISEKIRVRRWRVWGNR